MFSGSGYFHDDAADFIEVGREKSDWSIKSKDAAPHHNVRKLEQILDR